MFLPPHIPPPPPPPPAAASTKGPAHLSAGEQTPLQQILYAARKLPQWRTEEDLDPVDRSVWLAANNHVTPLIQDGPTCGLVVLKLALQLLQKTDVKVDNLLAEAREQKFSVQGEMFSAKNMLELATATSGCSGQLLSGGFGENREMVTTSLQKGNPVLVPYDADPNHEPGCHGGHKAHWSLLTGYLMRVPSSELDAAQWAERGLSVDPSCPNLFCLPPSIMTEAELHRLLRVSELFVFARQGKSKHLGVWSYTSLSESNSNLKEFSPSRDEGEYLIPPGGVEGGLCGKAVVLLPW